MTMSDNPNDSNSATGKVSHRKHNCPHVAIVGCMASSLGATIITGLKKSTKAHVVSSLCFGGTAMLHFFMHHRQLSHRMKTGLRPAVKGLRSKTKPKDETSQYIEAEA